MPKGVIDGERLRIPGRGGPGSVGGPDGDMYRHIQLQPHPLFWPVGHDLYLELPLAGKGLPKRGEGAGVHYAVLQIVIPREIGDREREFSRELATAATFQPRTEFTAGSTHG